MGGRRKNIDVDEARAITEMLKRRRELSVSDDSVSDVLVEARRRAGRARSPERRRQALLEEAAAALVEAERVA